jgi:hypothetical protein
VKLADVVDLSDEASEWGRKMSRHIGIVACSAEGAALCYRTICIEGAQLLGPHEHPEVSMHTHSPGSYMKRIYRGDWEGVGELRLSSARKLASAGANFLVCPDNTIHEALPLLLAAEPEGKRGEEHLDERRGSARTRARLTPSRSGPATGFAGDLANPLL